MTAYSLFTDFNDLIAKGGVGLLIVLTLIQISPIKIDPWSKLAEMFGNAVNKSVKEDIKDIKSDIDKINTKVDNLDEQMRENSAIEARNRILRFGDEVSHGSNHSRDHFQQILIDINNYDAYCDSHKDFKNHITKITADRIIADYTERDKNNDFL